MGVAACVAIGLTATAVGTALGAVAWLTGCLALAVLLGLTRAASARVGASVALAGTRSARASAVGTLRTVRAVASHVVESGRLRSACVREKERVCVRACVCGRKDV